MMFALGMETRCSGPDFETFYFTEFLEIVEDLINSFQ
jgi:hypothetical protein